MGNRERGERTGVRGSEDVHVVGGSRRYAGRGVDKDKDDERCMLGKGG